MSTSGVRQPHRVLLVDDYVPVAEAIARLLEVAGHTVQARFNGDRIVEHALAFQPDIILLDLGLQQRDDGVAIAGRLRAEPRLAGVYIVALTGRVNVAETVDLAGAGFDQYLVKPVGFDAIDEMMRRAEMRARRGQRTMAPRPAEGDHP